MTQDETIELARQAGIKRRTDVFFSEYCDGICFDDLETFAKLIATNTHPDGVDAEWVARRTKYAVEQEREACAKVCDDELKEWGIFDSDVGDVSKAIRARGQA